MKKLYGIIAIVFCCLFFFPVVAEAKTMELNKEYTAKVDCDDNGIETLFTLKIKEAGKYKVTISFDECYKSYYDDTPVYNYDLKAKFVVSSGKRDYYCEVPLEDEKSFVIGLDKGTAYISANDYQGEKYKISTIKFEKVTAKKYSFSQAYQFAKKNKKPDMALQKKNKIIRMEWKGFYDTSIHERDGYSMGLKVVPYIDINKQGKTTYATYNLFSTLLIYSIPYMDDSDLKEIVIYNKNDRIVYELDSCDESNQYDYVDNCYKDISICDCILFKSYTASTSDINKLINIIRADDAKIQIRDSAQKNTYYTIKFDKAS